ncbi:phosphatase 2C [Musa troglodytarum]|uniref:protein-serine/threonine phosphatase n=1 Tax=Musa troglodytarum TaxID=320322 RepID=A0A9E7I4V5_9LILI|nr:phosphatase 2C [Musa troglodytarum]
MEDAVSVRPDFVRGDHRYHFFGVYVGHGCSHVAESCRNRMHEVVAEEISTSRPGLDRERCAIMTPRCDHVGSTAVVAVVGPDRIVVASCGDSRAVLSHDGAPVPLSTDHKPDRPDELWRIEAAGGRVIYWDGARVLGVLATSRAIGDNHLKPYVISEPEVTVRKRKEGDECLLLASDGLWAVRRQADVPVE